MFGVRGGSTAPLTSADGFLGEEALGRLFPGTGAKGRAPTARARVTAHSPVPVPPEAGKPTVPAL